MEEIFIENPQSYVNSAFDSVNLIKELISQQIDDDKKSVVKCNIEHLKIMLSKDFFTKEITEEQKTEIESVIVSGNAYVV